MCFYHIKIKPNQPKPRKVLMSHQGHTICLSSCVLATCPSQPKSVLQSEELLLCDLSLSLGHWVHPNANGYNANAPLPTCTEDENSCVLKNTFWDWQKYPQSMRLGACVLHYWRNCKSTTREWFANSSPVQDVSLALGLVYHVVYSHNAHLDFVEVW